MNAQDGALKFSLGNRLESSLSVLKPNGANVVYSIGFKSGSPNVLEVKYDNVSGGGGSEFVLTGNDTYVDNTIGFRNASGGKAEDELKRYNLNFSKGIVFISGALRFRDAGFADIEIRLKNNNKTESLAKYYTGANDMSRPISITLSIPYKNTTDTTLQIEVSVKWSSNGFFDPSMYKLYVYDYKVD